MSVGLRVPANAIATNEDVGVPTKMSLNVRHRATPSCAKTQPSRHRRKNCASRNQAKILAREQVTRRPPTLDCGSTNSASTPSCAVLPPSSVATPYLNANVSWPACVGERH